MKAEIAIEKVVGGRRYYLVVNDAYRIKINKRQYNTLFDIITNKSTKSMTLSYLIPMYKLENNGGEKEQ